MQVKMKCAAASSNLHLPARLALSAAHELLRTCARLQRNPLENYEQTSVLAH